MATYNSDYFDYSYERTSYSKYVKYNLTAPEDSVSVNVSKASMYTPGTVDYEITEDAEYFKSEIERADDW
ncbi:MAG: hypothetical protein MJA31_18485, partial [Clostridia bacterium]|nr:hypothetical protein [Clostridia bacterium]